MKTRGKRGGRADDLKNQMSRKLKWRFYCNSHVLKKELCPAWDKRCNFCGKMNHWKGSEMCEKMDKMHLLSQDSEFSDSDSDVINVLVSGVCSKKDKPIYCEICVNAKTIKLLVDYGATACITPKSLVGQTQIESYNGSPEMWNKVKMKALRTCKLLVENPQTLLKYLVKFVVVEENLTRLLSRNLPITIRETNLACMTGLCSKVNVSWWAKG